MRGGLRGAQMRAYERLYDPPPLACRWRMSRLFWLPTGGQTVVLRTHRLEIVHNGSRPARCARVSVYPMDEHLDPRRSQYRRLEVWISSPRLSALVAPYGRWTPLRIAMVGRGAWSVSAVPKHQAGLWLAAHLLEEREGALIEPVELE
ncbi:hypothetical protein [Streptomyces gardneri]|uniref:hypothetical protein n=1 Tax=Streptomyces gardneri TaxID=66892 RepID=UPI0035DB4770